MRYSKDFLDSLKARVRLSDVISPHVRLTRAGKNWKGLSPFNKEKTPSFFVDDEQGRYKCFSSGEGGDHVSFLMSVRGLSFQEAVESLAEDAGISLPTDSPAQSQAAMAKARAHTELLDVVEEAARFFERCFLERQGQQALHYLRGRGISDETARAFRIGYAPDSFSALHHHLSEKGVSDAQLIAAGLARRKREGQGIYDIFRNRLMFPITDRRGKVIAFGGRALSADDPAKYLNSPATDLFDKSRVLYNMYGAREAYHDRSGEGHGTLIVAEGYMDVIALHDASFRAAVAPLGTAMTTHHLELLWHVSPKPLFCFDGDRAGQAAAFKTAEMALPLLKPGFSLDFIVLPQGSDPDDIVRQHGPKAMKSFVDQAKPLVSILWDKLFDEAAMSSPDTKVAFRFKIEELVRKIAHPTLREYYLRELTGRRLQAERQEEEMRFGSLEEKHWSSKRRGGGGYGPNTRQTTGGSSTGRLRDHRRRSALRSSSGGSNGRTFASRPGSDMSEALKQSTLVKIEAHDGGREELLLAIVLNHPHVLDDDLESFATITFNNRQLDKLRNQILSTIESDLDLDRDTLLNHVKEQGLALIVERLLGSAVVKTNRFTAPEADQSAVKNGWEDLIRRMSSIEMLHNDFLAAQEAYAKSETEENWARIVALKAQLQKLEQYQDQ